MQFNQQQNELLIQKMNEALDGQWMSWDKELEAWHKLAIASLEFASIASLEIEATHYPMLFKKETRGLNMNVVMILANQMLKVSPRQMAVDCEKWGKVMIANDRVLRSWHTMVEPTRKKIIKEIESKIIPAKTHIIGAR